MFLLYAICPTSKSGLLQTPFFPPPAAGRKDEARTPRALAKGCRPLHSYPHASSSRSCNSPDFKILHRSSHRLNGRRHSRYHQPCGQTYLNPLSIVDRRHTVLNPLHKYSVHDNNEVISWPESNRE